MAMEDSKSPEVPTPPQPISYRTVQLGLTEWAVVDSFTSIAEWHAAKAVLDRHGVLVRMASNPFDDDLTDLLVPRTDVFWAAELLRQGGTPKIEQALGFPLVKPLPLPGGPARETETASEPTLALPVLELDRPSSSPDAALYYGCALTALWSMLTVVILLLVLLFGVNW